jgi:2-iminoacetate synthase
MIDGASALAGREWKPRDVVSALDQAHLDLADVAALLSPAARPRLEEIAQRARQATLRRFGRTIRLFAPMYVSNECVTTCTYCGFAATNTQIVRKTLTPAEAFEEARALTSRGFRHLLLVSGEHPRIVNREYLAAVISALAPLVPSISIETQVWDTQTYRHLAEAGCEGVVVYQETYDPKVYAAVHLKGKKKNYGWRLEAPERAAAAGMRRLGIGALLGLSPSWRADALALVAHARHLEKVAWRCELTVSVPRLRPCAGGIAPRASIDQRDFAQLICALRLALPEIGIVLSTREAPSLRDALVSMGVTHMSAGSHTEPGGYLHPGEAEAQFEIEDRRTPVEVAAMVRRRGYDVVWKDWARV